jgi:hypothetical protein
VRSMETGAKKSASKRGGTKAVGGSRRRLAGRYESTLEIMERLLARKVSISLKGEPQQAPAMQAIVLQLLQKVLSGKARAWRTLLKYQAYANGRAERSTQLKFEESDYTKALAKPFSGNEDG